MVPETERNQIVHLKDIWELVAICSAVEDSKIGCYIPDSLIGMVTLNSYHPTFKDLFFVKIISI